MNIDELKNQIKNPASLTDFQLIKDEYDDRLKFGSLQDKQDLADFLDQLLAARGREIIQANAEMNNQYQTMIAMLQFNSFIGQEQADQNFLLQKRLLSAVQRGFSPDEIIRQYFSFFDFDDVVKTQFLALSASLSQNTETLGRMPLETEGGKLVPELKYWLADYAKFPSKMAQRGAVERLTYVNQSPNTRQLTQVQRQNLLAILKFYDDLIRAERPADLVRPVSAYEEQEEQEEQETTRQAGNLPELPQNQGKPASGLKIPIPVPTPQVTSSGINIENKLKELRSRAQQ